MSLPIPKATKPPKIQIINNNDWISGVVSAYDDGRTPIKGLKSSTNTMLDQDGVVRERYSLVRYKPQPVGEVRGAIFQYRYASAGTVINRLITLQTVAGVTKVYTATPGTGTWTVKGSVTFNNTASARFVQQDNKVVILNGEDNIAYYDIVLDTVVSFTALANATAPTLTTNTGLTGTAFKVYYAVTANSSVGETSGAGLTVQVSTDRDLWNHTTQSIKIGWTTVVGVKSWNIYCAVSADGASNPVWGLLATGISADTLEFTDKGNNGTDGATGPINTFKDLPTQNSTAGPKAKRGTNINGQLWLTGDKNNPYYVWHDGGAGFQLDFTVANGGGFTSLGEGNREIPEVVWNFRSGQGTAEIKALTSGVAGKGKRYTIAPNTITYAQQEIIIWTPQEDYGFSGTNSPDALIEYGDSTYYPSPDGFKSLGTRPQLQNLLSNDSISQTIAPDMGIINNSAMDKSVAVGHRGRLYFSVATLGKSKPNQIWVLDIDRQGAWMKPWEVACDWMVVIDDNDGNAHHLVLKNNVIYEFSDTVHTQDDGVAFPTSGQTGLIYFSEDGRVWGRLIKLVIEVLRPRGRINFSVSGFTDDAIFMPLATGEINEQTQTSGYGWGEYPWNYVGWNTFESAPSVTSKISVDLPIEVDEDIRYFAVNWSTSEANVSYSISRLSAEYVSIGIKNLD